MKKYISDEEKARRIIRDSSFPLLAPEFKEENLAIKKMLDFNRPKTDEEFGFYLAGLYSSDGSFSLTPELAFNGDDVALAYYIKNRINSGYVTKSNIDYCYKYGIGSKEGITRLLNLINGKFFDDYKLNYMKEHNYETKYNLKILPKIESPFNPYPLNKNHFLAGFTEG